MNLSVETFRLVTEGYVLVSLDIHYPFLISFSPGDSWSTGNYGKHNSYLVIFQEKEEFPSPHADPGLV